MNNKESFKIMRSSNPLVIPRNHKVEEVLIASHDNVYGTTKNIVSVDHCHFYVIQVLSWRHVIIA